MSRWIRVSADIFEHELFAQAELSEREAWLWLVAKAAWKDTRHRIGSEMVAVPRGSLFCTLRELRDEWRWKSDFKVRSFLEMLVAESMVERSANAGKTHVTICNYDKYQTPSDDLQRTENASETHGKRTESALKIPVYQDTKEDTSLRSVSGAPESDPQSFLEKPKSKLTRMARKSPSTPAPEGFWPDEAGLRTAAECGMTAADIRSEVASMLNRAARDDARYANWQAAWRTWCGNFKKFGKARASPPPFQQQRRGSAAIFDALTEIENAEHSFDKRQPESAVFMLSDSG